MIHGIRMPILVHRDEDGPPDLSGFIDPIRIPAILVTGTEPARPLRHPEGTAPCPMSS